MRARVMMVALLSLLGAGACDRILDLPERSYGPDAGARETAGSLAGGGASSSGSGGDGSTHDPVDSAQYNFEADTQGWEFCGKRIAGISVSSAKAYAGERSLAVDLQVNAGGLRCQGAQDPERMQLVYIRSPSISPGKIVTFHVWIPAASAIVSVQPYLLSLAGTWEGDYRLTSNLAVGAWNTFAVKYPSDASPLEQLGVELVTDTSSSWSGACYVDTVSF